MEIDFEDQYRCSRRSIKSTDTDFVVKEFVRITTAATDEAKANVPHALDIPYGDTARQVYDVYGTDLPNDSGIFVFIHGGYWQALDKTCAGSLAQPLYKNHVKLVAVDYDLCPEVKVKDIIDEIHVFVRHILGKAVDLGSVGVWFGGHSAGAHLASTLLDTRFLDTLTAQQQNLLKGLVLFGGVYDVTPIVATTINDPLHLTLEDAENVSTQAFFDNKHSVKILSIVGSVESEEFHKQSQVIHEKSLQAGNSSELLIIEGHDHFTVVENLSDDDFFLTRKIIAFCE